MQRDVDLFFMGNRQAKKRLDEVDRIVRWGRIAPPFGARAEGGTEIAMDSTLLCDSWAFEPGDTWDKGTWGETLEQCAPARVTRGGLPLPNVVEVSGAVAPPTPVTLQPCSADSDALQRFARSASGEWELEGREGRCLLGNVTDEGVYLAACSALAKEQERLSLPPNGQLQVVTPHSSMCVTAPDCSVTNASHASCMPGSALELQTCGKSAPLPLQSWSHEAGKLVLSASNFSTGGTAQQRCAFSQHSTAFSVSADGSTASVTGVADSAGGNSNVVGQCFGGGSAAGLHFRITVTKLAGQAFIGVSHGKLTDWANSPGAFGYGSTGLRASTAGYEKTGIKIDPRTGRKAALESFDTGDAIGVSVVAGVMSVTKNGGTPVVIFDNVPSQGLSVSVWSAPSSTGSSFAFTGEAGGIPACVTAAPVATHAAPFIAATRYPSHAVSVASLGRTAPRPIGYHTPLVNVTQDTLLGLKDARNGALPAIVR